MFFKVDIRSECGAEIYGIQVKSAASDPTSAELIRLVKMALSTPAYDYMLAEMGLTIGVKGGILGSVQIIDRQSHRVLSTWRVTGRVAQDSRPWVAEAMMGR
jgi:hypothetical protein